MHRKHSYPADGQEGATSTTTAGHLTWIPLIGIRSRGVLLILSNVFVPHVTWIQC